MTLAAAVIDDEPSIAMPSCIVCSGEAGVWMHVPCDWRRPEDARAFHLYWCNNCGCGHLHPRPSTEDVAASYNVKAYYTHEVGSRSARSQAVLHSMLCRIAWQFDHGEPISVDFVRQLAQGHALRICDVGCGNGTLLMKLIKAGHECIGVDPDPHARAQAEASGVSVMHGTAEYLPEQLPRRAFDLVILQHVLEHCEDPAAALRRCASLLAPTGRLCVEVPNNAAVGLEHSGPCWHWLDVPRHLNFFTKESLTRLCQRNGLEVSAVEYHGYFRQFTREWIRAEQRIHDCFSRHGVRPRQGRHSLWRAWRLLIRTLLTDPDRKYDSIRVLAACDAKE